MFKLNDTVVYGSEGVCKITDIEELDFTGEKKKYYVLKPVNSKSSTYFAPLDNEKILAKMRMPLSKEEVDKLIDSMPKEEVIWIANDIERKERYRSIISEGNHTELIKLIKSIFFEKKEREANKRKLSSSDENFLKDAEQVLHGEFQYVLNLSEDQLIAYIFERIEKNN